MITPESPRKLFLIDAYALIFRAYYAFIKNPRINSQGLNTSAIFGFTNAVLEVLRNERPTHLAVAFDAPGDTFRNELFPEYKANRDETPEDIKRSVPFILKVLQAFDIPIITLPGYEADDLIGYLAHAAAKEDFDVYMMTPDKDFGQLVTDRVKVYKPAKGGNPPEVLGPREVCERFGVDHPLQIIDLLGLMGDSVDNIPGIAGVGPKTASRFIQQYGSIEGLLEHTHELKGKLREKVEAGRASAMLSKELATICLDLPYPVDLPAMRVGEPDVNAVRAVFEELEFRSLLQRVMTDFGVGTSPAAVRLPEGQLGLFDAPPAAAEVSPPVLATRESAGAAYRCVTERAELDDLVRRVGASQRFAFTVLTAGPDARSADLIGCAFATEARAGWWVPVASGAWDLPELLAALAPVFADPEKEAIAHNFKDAYLAMRRHGVRINNRAFDTLVAHYLLQPEAGHALDQLAEVELAHQPLALSAVIGEKGKDQIPFAAVPADQWTDYACETADLTWQLADRYRPQLEAVAATELARDVEFPLIAVLAEVEREGVHLDGQRLAEYSVELAQRIAGLESEIHRLAERPFNVDSPKQLGPILFEHLGIPAKVKRTATGQYPTGEDVLIKLEQLHPIVPLILEYRKLKKLLSTYVEPLPKLIDAATGRLHTHYQQTVAATGRLSSTHPNLQNIPIRTPEGRAIRKAFVPRDADHVLVAADYSQVELRIAAAMSGDPGLCDAFRDGLDIHTATAARVFGVALGDVDRDMRSKAKAVNFGILYGQGAFGLAQTLAISRSEAKDIIDAYFAQFQDLKAFIQASIDRARETGYAETLMGRRRYLPDIASANTNVRAFAERNAVNAPIQGSAADIIKVAMLRIQRLIEEEGWGTRMIMQVHDELVFDVPRGEVATVVPAIRRAMEGAAALSVPLEVDVKTGEDWLEAH